LLDGDLPKGCRAHEDRVLWIEDGVVGPLAQQLVAVHPPEQRVGIEEKREVHPHAASSSWATGPVMSPRIRPWNAPGRRSTSVRMGTMRAISLPALATMTSSPRWTRSSSLEK